MVYQVADKYMVNELKYKAEQRFLDSLSSMDPNAAFSRVIREVYAAAPTEGSGLRRGVVIKALSSIDKLMEDDEYLRVLREVPGFAADIVCRVIEAKRANETLFFSF